MVTVKPKTKMLALHLDEIKTEFNIRDGWNGDGDIDDRYFPGLEELRVSIETQGFKASKPVEVFRKDGKYILSEGNRRVAASKLVEGYSEHVFAADLPPGHIWAVEVTPPSQQELIVNQITSNISEECTPFDISKAAQLLMSDPTLADADGVIVTKKSQREDLVAKLLNLNSRQRVKLYLALQSLNPGLKRILLESSQSNEPAIVALYSVMRILSEYGEHVGNQALSTALQEGIDKGSRIGYPRIKEIAEAIKNAGKKTEPADEEETITIVNEDEVEETPFELTDDETVEEAEETEETTVFVGEEASEKLAELNSPQSKEQSTNRKSNSQAGLLLELGKLGKKIYHSVIDTLTTDGGTTTIMLKEEEADKLVELLSAIDELDLDF